MDKTKTDTDEESVTKNQRKNTIPPNMDKGTIKYMLRQNSPPNTSEAVLDAKVEVIMNNPELAGEEFKNFDELKVDVRKKQTAEYINGRVKIDDELEEVWKLGDLEARINCPATSITEKVKYRILKFYDQSKATNYAEKKLERKLTDYFKKEEVNSWKEARDYYKERTGYLEEKMASSEKKANEAYKKMQKQKDLITLNEKAILELDKNGEGGKNVEKDKTYLKRETAEACRRISRLQLEYVFSALVYHKLRNDVLISEDDYHFIDDAIYAIELEKDRESEESLKSPFGSFKDKQEVIKRVKNVGEAYKEHLMGELELESSRPEGGVNEQYNFSAEKEVSLLEKLAKKEGVEKSDGVNKAYEIVEQIDKIHQLL